MPRLVSCAVLAVMQRAAIAVIACVLIRSIRYAGGTSDWPSPKPPERALRAPAESRSMPRGHGEDEPRLLMYTHGNTFDHRRHGR